MLKSGTGSSNLKMPNSNSSTLKLCSYNMHGYNNGVPMTKSLCDQHDIVLLQEHWLPSSDLGKLDLIHPDFRSFSVSAMDCKTSTGILIGRPFGGTAILYRIDKTKFLKLVDVDSTSGRYTSIRYNDGMTDVIITNVYFPTLKYFHTINGSPVINFYS